MQFDSGGEDPARSIIFSSYNKAELISLIDTILVDGTFEATPIGFKQLVGKHDIYLEKQFH